MSNAKNVLLPFTTKGKQKNRVNVNFQISSSETVHSSNAAVKKNEKLGEPAIFSLDASYI